MKSKLIVLFFIGLFVNCSKNNEANSQPNPPPTTVITGTSQVDFWLTKADQSVLLQKQNVALNFGTALNSYQNIDVADAQLFQTIEGFGYSLTGGSAQVINTLNPAKKAELLQELFGTNSTSIGVSYLRVSIGSSDLDASTFSYNDLGAGQTDLTLANFNLAPDMTNLVPLIKQILLINPNIKIMGSPWSPPTWMKSNNSTIGGSLQTQYYQTYANYFVKYIQKMQQEGITINAITIQNEPLYGGNNPSMLMTATEQANFIKNNLGPAFQTAGITTKIIIYDHNCDQPNYPISILNDAAARPFVSGSGFHLYAGTIDAMSTVHDAYPTKDVYFTEQWTSSVGNFGVDLKSNVKNVVIGSMRNWSKATLQWNLANNASFGPNTPGGCTQCKGAVTIVDANNFIRNVAYYTIAHASKFAPAGSVRIGSSNTGNLQSVAFKTPAGKFVLIVLNDGNTTELFNIKINNAWVSSNLEAGSVGTYTW